MLKTRTISGLVVTIGVIALGLYDLWAYLQNDDGTVSVWVWYQTQTKPWGLLIVYFSGFVAGHLLWAADEITVIKE